MQVTWNEGDSWSAYLNAMPMGAMVVETMLTLKQTRLSIVLLAKEQPKHG